MSLNFPSNPNLNDTHMHNGISYIWNSVKWVNMNKLANTVVGEYHNITTQSANTVLIEPDKYDYYKIDLDEDITFDIPNASPNTSFVVEFNRTASSAGYDLANASYDNVSFSVSTQDTTPIGLFFKPDGTKMYIAGSIGDNVYEYNLSTAWNISSASHLQNFSVAAQDTTPIGLFFKPDGTKMYITGNIGDDVNEYNLSTAWNISSASYLQNFSVAAQDNTPIDLFFKPDGTKMYVIGLVGDDVNEYNLSTPWDISSASYLQNFSVAAQDTTPIGLFFKPDGTKMYIAGSIGDNVYEYNLSTAWNISSASFVDNFSVAAQDNDPIELFFKPDGTKMYVLGSTGDAVYQYSTGTLSFYTITWGDNIKWAGGIAPSIDFTYETNILINFTTFDGSTWIGNPLSLDLRNV